MSISEGLLSQIIYAFFESGFVILTKKWTRLRHMMEKVRVSITPTDKITRQQILDNTPTKYHDIILPNYGIGCKRRVLDPEYMYLRSLHSPKMYLTRTALTRIAEYGVYDENGTYFPADVIILANGFAVGGHILSLNVTGSRGRTLLDYWKDKQALSSYRSAVVSEFPNFFILNGPNSASGHLSVIYTVECQVAYVCKLV